MSIAIWQNTVNWVPCTAGLNPLLEKRIFNIIFDVRLSNFFFFHLVSTHTFRRLMARCTFIFVLSRVFGARSTRNVFSLMRYFIIRLNIFIFITPWNIYDGGSHRQRKKVVVTETPLFRVQCTLYTLTCTRVVIVFDGRAPKPYTISIKYSWYLSLCRLYVHAIQIGLQSDLTVSPLYYILDFST